MKYQFPLDIALIDDEADILELTNMAVNQLDELNPICFTNPQEALETIIEKKIRIICTDLIMPVMTGTQILEESKQFEWNTDIIVLTGLEQLETAAECFDAGAREVLIKPIETNRLLNSIRRIIERYEIWHKTYEKL